MWGFGGGVDINFPWQSMPCCNRDDPSGGPSESRSRVAARGAKPKDDSPHPARQGHPPLLLIYCQPSSEGSKPQDA